jgi:hypothetical protein
MPFFLASLLAPRLVAGVFFMLMLGAPLYFYYRMWEFSQQAKEQKAQPQQQAHQVQTQPHARRSNSSPPNATR